MKDSWIYGPVVFFGRRINMLFAAILSVPVWLAAHTFMSNMAVPDDEAVATGITIAFFTAIFAGRYIAQIWSLHRRPDPRSLVVRLGLFIAVCMCVLVLHADFPFSGAIAINLLLYLGPFLGLSLAAGIAIKIVRALAEEQLTAARNAAAHSESELRLLQSQLSPHFLFNTLNNMYGLSLTQCEKVPALLLQLSDLLRYSVYGANETFVPLREELGYIRNYIAFEQIRLGERLVLETNINLAPDDNTLIAPMLLIVFIENAFKHAKNTADERIFIRISLETWHDLLLFSVKNSHCRGEKQFDRNSGFGLDNVRKRLALLYPENYQLDIEEDDQMYSVMFRVKKR